MDDFLFDRSVSQVAEALDWSDRRQKIITSNIANKDTPQYKAVDLDFQRIMEGIFTGQGMPIEKTNPGHILPSSGSATPVVNVKTGQQRLDGNTVNLTDEVAHMVENNLLYQTLGRYLNNQFKLTKLAISGG